MFAITGVDFHPDQGSSPYYAFQPYEVHPIGEPHQLLPWW